MALKFAITDHGDEYTFIASAGTVELETNTSFDKGTKLAAFVRKNLVREDAALEASLVKALKAVGLDADGKTPKVVKPVKGASPFKA